MPLSRRPLLIVGQLPRASSELLFFVPHLLHFISSALQLSVSRNSFSIIKSGRSISLLDYQCKSFPEHGVHLDRLALGHPGGVFISACIVAFYTRCHRTARYPDYHSFHQPYFAHATARIESLARATKVCDARVTPFYGKIG